MYAMSTSTNIHVHSCLLFDINNLVNLMAFSFELLKDVKC